MPPSRYITIDGVPQDLPTKVADKRLTGLTTGPQVVLTYTVGSVDEDLVAYVALYMSLATNFTFSVLLGYTDEGGNARSQKMSFVTTAGTVVVNCVNTNGAIYPGLPLFFRAQANSAVSISIGTGTFTSVTYNIDCAITKVTQL